MTDIVEWLRSAKTWLNEGECCGQIDASGTCMAPACIFGEALKLSTEAADEIEKLRAALTKADKLYRICDGEIPEPENIKAVWDDTKASVRAALEGK